MNTPGFDKWVQYWLSRGKKVYTEGSTSSTGVKWKGPDVRWKDFQE